MICLLHTGIRRAGGSRTIFKNRTIFRIILQLFDDATLRPSHAKMHLFILQVMVATGGELQHLESRSLSSLLRVPA